MTREEFKKQHSNELDKNVTLGVLLQFTDEFLIPKMAEMVEDSNKSLKQELKQEMSQMEHRLKSYVDDKLADQTSDIFLRLEKKDQKEKHFREKIIELFQRHQIGTAQDISFLKSTFEQG